MNDTLYQILLISFGLIFLTSLAMLIVNRRRPAAAAPTPTAVPASPVKVVTPVATTAPRADSRVKWAHPANLPVLAALRLRHTGSGALDSAPEEEIDVPGAHPDLTAYVFETLRGELPAACCWIANGHPVLVHPRSGVIFALAIGSECVALRLPIDARHEAWTVVCTMENDCLTSADLGHDWVFMLDVAAPGDAWAAYEHAAMA